MSEDPLTTPRQTFDTLAQKIYSYFRQTEVVRQSSPFASPSPFTSKTSPSVWSKAVKDHKHAIHVAQKLLLEVTATIAALEKEVKTFCGEGMVQEVETVDVWLGECRRWEEGLRKVVREFEDEVGLLEMGI